MFKIFKYRWLRTLTISIMAIITSGAIYGAKSQNLNRNYIQIYNSKAALKESDSDKQLKVHFLSVGDAESILVQQGGTVMLIDAGNDKDDKTVLEYLHRQGVKRIDYLIGTHPHEDHIGALDYVINNIDVEKVYFPKYEGTNKYLEDVKLAVKKKGLEISNLSSGDTVKVGNATCTILAPISLGYEDINNYSIVMKLQFGKTSFLLTGDAERESEMEMMRRGYDLTADVLKLGHHGSITSTSNEFLERVNPKYVVLCTDTSNKYKHPHNNTMKKLKAKRIKLYRTDESGTIVIVSDGEIITFNVKSGSYRGK